MPSVISPDAIHRLHLGHFTLRGNDAPDRKIVVCAYLIEHPGGLVLFDTGIGVADPESEAHWQPVRRSLREALGVPLGDVSIVVNCHLHADHAGGNPMFAGTPIFAQTVEHDAAQQEGYTIGEIVDFHGARYELFDGEADVLAGLRIIPTPGHAPGHQSLVIDTTDGLYILAGQAVNFASDYAIARYAWELHRGGADDVEYPQWIARLQELDPQRVLFAHDLAIWDAAPLSSRSAPSGGEVVEP
jgi:glyoxylase-like metal-dependent hydrolase (beta-lactamase superfamily II)